jgi:hypothetical protein
MIPDFHTVQQPLQTRTVPSKKHIKEESRDGGGGGPEAAFLLAGTVNLQCDGVYAETTNWGDFILPDVSDLFFQFAAAGMFLSDFELEISNNSLVLLLPQKQSIQGLGDFGFVHLTPEYLAANCTVSVTTDIVDGSGNAVADPATSDIVQGNFGDCNKQAYDAFKTEYYNYVTNGTLNNYTIDLEKHLIYGLTASMRFLISDRLTPFLPIRFPRHRTGLPGPPRIVPHRNDPRSHHYR